MGVVEFNSKNKIKRIVEKPKKQAQNQLLRVFMFLIKKSQNMLKI